MCDPQIQAPMIYGKNYVHRLQQSTSHNQVDKHRPEYQL